ncbi:MAG TPA: alanine--glyoxylate aminotransferase family protein [Gemmataceae bacterium]|jgi:alanine-glyoxylate transaminase/serine-glyoxylate transaminase/serine-pyruvate transaminase|nr:alanine--glyoxylate aminotransferase family protein [Gemmataceae bacterium]
MNQPGQLNVSPRVLLGPGPSDVHPRVLTAMATPLVGHLDPQFLEIMNETQDMLRQVFQTRNLLTFPVSGTGSAGMETCVVNLIERGDKMVVCVNGVFGQRMTDVARRAGANVATIERPWGEVFDAQQVRDVLRKERPKVLGIVHAETSTGAWQPMTEIGPLCQEAGALLLLDTVTSLAGVPVEVDVWGVDAVYSGTQKCLSCPPGLAPVSFSSRAVEVINHRKTKVQSWYLDMGMVQRYWGEERFYHHTAPITMIYALREALRLVVEEGLRPRWERHLRNHQALKAGLAALGISYTAMEGHQLPMLNAVRIPAGVDDQTTRQRLLAEFGIEIGGGLGDFKGKAWRIGLMGHSSRANNVLLLLAGLEQCLATQRAKVTPGAGVAAANRIYAQP